MNQMFAGVTAMHLAGNGNGDSMGYVFPDGPASVFGYRNAYNDRWSSINANQAMNPPGDPLLTARYQVLSRPYPAQPSNAAFSSVLLPNATTADVNAYRTAPETVTLTNTAAVQAVEEKTLGVTGANFWSDQPTTVNRGGQPWLSSDKKASVMIRVASTTVTVSVSDPTQLNTGTIAVTLAVPVQAKSSGDTRISMTSSAGSPLAFTVNVNGTKGAPVAATFTR